MRVAFLWHMHQPSYRDPIDGSVALPWVRLHALKDYLGMVRLLDATPEVRVTFNLVPSLLDQLEACAAGRSEDVLHRIARLPAAELSPADRLIGLRGFFMAHRQNLIGRFPRFVELLALRGEDAEEPALRSAAARFGVSETRDLQLLSQLAWFDLEWLASDATLRALAEKGRDFTEEDKARLFERERALLQQVLPAYRQAFERGQVELSTSPYYHPILPLLCDTEAHHEAHPGAPLPRRYRHPEDAADQIRRAVVRHERQFGARPAGMWPSEGSVSEEAVAEMARAGLGWTASDEGVLARSAGQPVHRDSRGTAYPLELLYQPWSRSTPSGGLAIAFRDRALSDLIGFSYSAIEPQHAAADLLDRFRRVGERWAAQGLPGDPAVFVILDGENAWEHYREGGRDFLRAVYRGLASDPGLAGVTVGEALAAAPRRELPRVAAGSWINADFSVWIGHPDDRRAWDLLGETREVLARHGAELSEADREWAWETYRSACGSDWCWWYGGDHHSENDLEFDRLFRRHLEGIYEALGRPAPAALQQTLITTRGFEGRDSRPTGAIRPLVDGRLGSPDEWVAAGVHRTGLMSGAMRPGSRHVEAVRYGTGDERLFVLVETLGPARDALANAEVALAFPGPTALRYRVGASGLRREELTSHGWVGSATAGVAAADDVVEIGIPLSELRPDPARRLSFRVLWLEADLELERHPETGPLSIALGEVTRD